MTDQDQDAVFRIIVLLHLIEIDGIDALLLFFSNFILFLFLMPNIDCIHFDDARVCVCVCLYFTHAYTRF